LLCPKQGIKKVNIVFNLMYFYYLQIENDAADKPQVQEVNLEDQNLNQYKGEDFHNIDNNKLDDNMQINRPVVGANDESRKGRPKVDGDQEGQMQALQGQVLPNENQVCSHFSLMSAHSPTEPTNFDCWVLGALYR
jgi:hypothetical protein